MPRFRPSAVLAITMLGLWVPLGASLSGCVVAAVGGGAVAGYAVLAEDLSPGQQLRDIAIKAEVSHSWGQFNRDLAHRLSATVFDGQVLITGRVPSRHWRDEAVKRAWRVKGVTQVFDEIVVGPDTHFIDEARDTWITTQLRGELIGDIDVKSINYVITTSDRVVYLMGVARTQSELDDVVNLARRVAGVRRVVSFVRLLSTRPAGPLPGASHPPPPAGRMPPPRPSGGTIKSEPLQ